jgi:Uma2 family endonuclease
VGDLHRFTVDDYHRMAEAGILHEDSRVELIRGRIVDMAAIGSAHMVAVNRLNRLLAMAVGDRGVISIQNPVRLDKASEPDVAVLRPGADDLGAPIPGPSDVLLLIEVADSTLRDDRDEKGPLYAESGIAEYWIVNLMDQVFEVYRGPEAGHYKEVRRVGPGDELDMVMLPGVGLAVSTLRGTQLAEIQAAKRMTLGCCRRRAEGGKRWPGQARP